MPTGALATRKVLSSGAVKGHVGEGSSSAAIADPGRAGDRPGLFTGYSLRLLDHSGRRVRETRIAHSDEAGLLRLAPSLDAPPDTGAPYELVSGEPAPVLGIRLLTGLGLGEPIGPVRVKLGTTRGTNALLEQKGAPVALVTTRGLADVLEVGPQTRPHLFDLAVSRPSPLYREVVEADERMDATGRVLRPLDEKAIERDLRTVRRRGVDCVAVALAHAYANDAHERRIAEIAADLGFPQISVASSLSPTIKLLDRGDTAVLDAYLSPVLRDYIAELRRRMPEATLQLMDSAGGLVDAERFTGKDSLLSGPAGGVTGYADVAQRAGFTRAIGFDMGGTSSDVSRFDGDHEHRFRTEMHGVRVATPMYAIETVAAGGGSVCRFDGSKLTVGPDSAGAEPGPACYGRGGPLTVTDVDLFSGRIHADHFPFPLDTDAVHTRLTEVAAAVERGTGRRMDLDAIAEGFTQVANLNMATAIRSISAGRGDDPASYLLVAFGGAGPQHACGVAESLGVRRVLTHPLGGVISAYGLGVADVRRFAERTVLQELTPETLRDLEPTFDRMAAELREEILAEGIAPAHVEAPRRQLDLRYRGEDASIAVPTPSDGDYAAAFEARHGQLYGHTHPGRPIEIATMRVDRIGRTPKPAFPTADLHPRRPSADHTTTALFHGRRHPTAIFHRDRLHPGDRIEGPAMVVEPFSVTAVDPGWVASVTERFDMILEAGDSGTAATPASTERDPVRLELFNNHFTRIATQMGRTLQRTALSVNVKERLDFSCALLSAEGDLVVNAPHIPVHLGAMSEAVKALLADVSDIRPGDVYASNDPGLGGSHLPDVTVMTPVFDVTGRELRFFAASRAHHAEIGGVRPGSSYPFARCLAEEGVVLRNLRIRAERFDDVALRHALTSGPWPSRAPEENVADVRSAIAANRAGLDQLRAMIESEGWPAVAAYMGYIREAAEAKVREAIGRLPDGKAAYEDALDDGAPIRVETTVGGDRMRIDFTGTGPPNPNSLNANRAIVQAAVVYCLRCLTGDPIPLNSGVLAPVELIVPESMLDPPRDADPSRRAAVVGGNVELSQRVVDVFLAALGQTAASQGTMNNFVFGGSGFGYYETLGGGTGAGPGFDGASAVHSHMTNTRLTDVEVLEQRFPVRVETFRVRRGSGGEGRRRGGDGLIRALRFLSPLDVSLLSQRRVRPPFGLAGGGPGAVGRNVLERKGTGEVHSLGPLAQVRVESGDVVRIETPGGGGHG